MRFIEYLYEGVIQHDYRSNKSAKNFSVRQYQGKIALLDIDNLSLPSDHALGFDQFSRPELYSFYENADGSYRVVVYFNKVEQDVQKLFKSLKRAGIITQSATISSLEHANKFKTGDVVSGHSVFYHGTCFKFFESIFKKGIIPTTDVESSDKSIFNKYALRGNDKVTYLSTQPSEAAYYAISNAQEFDPKNVALVLQVKLPDISLVSPDDDVFYTLAIKTSLRFIDDPQKRERFMEFWRDNFRISNHNEIALAKRIDTYFSDDEKAIFHRAAGAFDSEVRKLTNSNSLSKIIKDGTALAYVGRIPPTHIIGYYYFDSQGVDRKNFSLRPEDFTPMSELIEMSPLLRRRFFR